jgi:SAM-dependent methyltransferase
MAERKDVWASGDAYEPYVGRWSRLVAREFVSWIAVPPGRRWLDIGCGTGALSQIILDQAAPQSLLGIDPSEGYVGHTKRAVGDQRAEFRVGDAQSLPVKDHSFDVAVAGLVINFVPDKIRAIREMARVVRRSGTAAAYVWDYAGEMQMMRRFWDAAVGLNPAALDKDEGRRFPVCRPEPLKSLFEDAGLSHVEVRAIDVQTVFKDFDDYWTPFLGGQGPAPGYCMSLPEDQRAVLKDRIRSTLRSRDDGSIQLIARAWAVRGIT